MQLGDTFLMPCPGFIPKIPHLWIVISDPAKCGGFFVMVNLTKNVNRAGKDCELNIGDHQWVDQKCYVNFADALEITPIQEKMINQLIASKAITMHFPIDGNVLQRIIEAGKQSKALAPKYKKYL